MALNDIPFIPPQCSSCKHRIPNKEPQATCRAFPKGIPQDIWRLKADHRLPYPGDNGIRWEPNRPDALHPREILDQTFARLEKENAAREAAERDQASG